ncbi:MAG TPA: hypothetical protein VIH81_15720 [Roseiarcus sp.]
MNAIAKKEDFVAACQKTKKDDPWRDRELDGLWIIYQAKVAFIATAYDDQGIRERLYNHIAPDNQDWNNDWCGWLDSTYSLGNIEDILIQANREGKNRIYDSEARAAFEHAATGIAAYLAAPREFQTHKADTFFLRYAANTAVLAIENGTVEIWAKIKRELMVFWVCALIQLAVVGGLTGTGLAWGAPWWANLIGVALTALSLIGSLYYALYWAFGGSSRRRAYAAAADKANQFRAITNELSAQSFDAETLLARLRAIEAEAGAPIPSYFYTLLKRLGGDKPETPGR